MTFRTLVLLALTTIPGSVFAEDSAFEAVRDATIAAEGQPIFWQGKDMTFLTATNPVRFDESIPDGIHVGIFRNSLDLVGAILVDHEMDGIVDFKIIAGQKLPASESDQIAFDTAISFLAEEL